MHWNGSDVTNSARFGLISRIIKSLTQHRLLFSLPCQVEDVLPPVFSVTPKGSGAGYGVGFDLDDLLNQSLTDLQHCDRDRWASKTTHLITIFKPLFFGGTAPQQGGLIILKHRSENSTALPEGLLPDCGTNTATVRGSFSCLCGITKGWLAQQC